MKWSLHHPKCTKKRLFSVCSSRLHCRSALCAGVCPWWKKCKDFEDAALAAPVVVGLRRNVINGFYVYVLCAGAPVAKLWQPLEHRQMFLQLQSDRHHQPDQRSHWVLGVSQPDVRTRCRNMCARALFQGAVCACVFLQAEHAPAFQRPGGAGGASLALGGHSGARLGPCLFLNLERSGVDGEGQTLTCLLLYLLPLLHITGNIPSLLWRYYWCRGSILDGLIREKMDWEDQTVTHQQTLNRFPWRCSDEEPWHYLVVPWPFLQENQYQFGHRLNILIHDSMLFLAEWPQIFF